MCPRSALSLATTAVSSARTAIRVSNCVSSFRRFLHHRQLIAYLSQWAIPRFAARNLPATTWAVMVASTLASPVAAADSEGLLPILLAAVLPSAAGTALLLPPSPLRPPLPLAAGAMTTLLAAAGKVSLLLFLSLDWPELLLFRTSHVVLYGASFGPKSEV